LKPEILATTPEIHPFRLVAGIVRGCEDVEEWWAMEGWCASCILEDERVVSCQEERRDDGNMGNRHPPGDPVRISKDEDIA
jgi:hypothetical protein